MAPFPRTAMAKELVQALRGRSFLGDAHNGLFLAAPRRTGKSTFLQADLTPALQAEGVVVVYVDLWADTRRDPGALIAEAIGRELQEHLGIVARAAKSAGLDKVKMGGLEVDTSRIGKIDGLTLTEALRLLHETARQPVALIIDEAQHALTSDEGETAMMALKSARDQINRPGAVNLMLVMSGSDRDKLLRLVNSGGAPFYGSQVQNMPPLGRDFIDHCALLIEAQRPDLAPVNRQQLHEAFEGFGSRPQFFMAALGKVLSPLAGLQIRFEAAMNAAALEQQAQDEAQMDADFEALKPLEQAVLWRMLEQGPRFRPYDAEALRFYAARTAGAVTVAQAQKAIEALRQQTPTLVWKSARGEYALNDLSMQRWFTKRVNAGLWPPDGRRPPLLSP